MFSRHLTSLRLLVAAAALASTVAHASPYTASARPFTFVDVSTTGTKLSIVGDDAANIISLPFAFRFYGQSYNTLGVSTNGLLTFDGVDTSFANADLSGSPTRAAIAVFWDDLFVNGSGASGIYTQTLGSGSNRSFVVQWNAVTFLSGSQDDPMTFEVILSEATGNIQFNYLDLVNDNPFRDNGGSATVGIKNSNALGADPLQLAYNNGPNAFVGTNQSTLISATPTAVPEPETLGLFAVALAGLALSRRRARQA